MMPNQSNSDQPESPGRQAGKTGKTTENGRTKNTSTFASPSMGREREGAGVSDDVMLSATQESSPIL